MAPMGIFRHCPCFRPHDDDVKILDYSHCCLDDVPNNVFTHERTLEELFLDSNQIRDLPRALFHCEGLRKLSLSDNEIQSIPVAVSSLLKLEHLNISKNHILQIPDTIRGCKCLTTVEVSINPLGPRLPDGFTQLINLQELYLNDTFLEFLPANFGRLARLEIVELRENHLKVLPKSMSRLVELRRLDIGQNDFLEFPDVIGSMPKLMELWCDSNRIISLPSCIGNLKNLNYLDVSDNKIEEIAHEIGNCESLSDLSLSSNNLTEIPESIGNLKNLTILRFDDNEMIFLPASIGNLSSLEEFVFNENQIEVIPSSIGFLRNLHTLIGDSNRISELPSSIGSCMQLRIVSLAGNCLKVIPDEMSRLACLKVLNLNSNQITHLPYSLTKLTQLQALWLSENQHKPLIQLQSDIDPDSGQKVLTCFLLPQLPLESSPKTVNSPNEQQLSNNNNNNTEIVKSVIKFSTDPDADIEDDSQLTRLIRAPTPYPKELKAHARHARNLALKQRDSGDATPGTCSGDGDNLTSINEMVLPVNGGETVHESKTSHSQFEIKEAKVSKAPKSPLSQRSNGERECPIRPSSLPVKSNFTANASIDAKDMLNDNNNVDSAAAKLSQLLTIDNNSNSVVNDPLQRSPHERKGSYKTAVARPSNLMKSPVENKLMIKSKIISPPVGSDRGYRSDNEAYSNDRPKSNEISIGYSSDFETNETIASRSLAKNFSPKKTPPINCSVKEEKIETDIPFESTSIIKDFNAVPHSDTSPFNCSEDSDAQTLDALTSNANACPAKEIAAQLTVKTDLLTIEPINIKDNLSNSSITSLYPSSGSDRGALSSRPSSFSSTSHTSQHSSLSPNEVPLTDIQNHPPALPPKPVNYKPSIVTQQTGIPPPPVNANRFRSTPTASSQFIIHKFSHDSFTPPRHPLVPGQMSTSMKPQPESLQHAWDSNGINFIDNSDESVSSNSPSNNSLLNNHQHMNHPNRWLLGAHSNAHVFPVIIVKNPGLGFTIESGHTTKNPIQTNGIYVSNVVENGPASTALKVGDKILQIDGIDLQYATKEKATNIFQSTGTTVSLMVLREKT